MSTISTVALHMLCGAILFVPLTARGAVAPEIALQAPSAAMPLVAGTGCAIKWRMTGYTGAVDIRLWDGERGEWSVTAKGIAAREGVYIWRVPDGLKGDLFRIEVRVSASPEAAARSREFLSIRARESSVAALAPAGEQREREACVVRPNPCSSNVTLGLGKRIPLNIDMTSIGSGITYHRAFVAEKGAAHVPTGDLRAGAYVVRVRCDDGETVVEKLIIRSTE